MSKNTIVGAWLLKSWSIIDEEKSISFPFGMAMGSIIYAENGYMSLSIMSKEIDTKEIISETLKSFDCGGFLYFSYSGKYFITGLNKVEHHIEVSSVKNWIGEINTRFFKRKGNSLLINASTIDTEGKNNQHTLTWQRA